MRKALKILKDPQVLILLAYLMAVAVLRWQFDWGVLFWIVGGVFGWVMVVLDRVVWVYWTRPQTQLSVQVRYLVSSRKFKEAWQTLWQRKSEQTELTFRSVLFQAAWVVLAFFTITSTPSMFGKGLVMGLGGHLLYDEWKDYLVSPQKVASWLFWQIKRSVSLEELKIYLVAMTGLFVFLTWILV